MKQYYEEKIFNMIKSWTPDYSSITYLNSMDEDIDGIQNSYIIYRVDISNLPKVYGDGLVLKRISNCEIYVFEIGDGNSSTSGTIANDIEQMLKSNNISYNIYTSGYDKTIKGIQTTFDFKLIGG